MLAYLFIANTSSQRSSRNVPEYHETFRDTHQQKDSYYLSTFTTQVWSEEEIGHQQFMSANKLAPLAHHTTLAHKSFRQKPNLSTKVL
jgi:hypothetical protein